MRASHNAGVVEHGSAVHQMVEIRSANGLIAQGSDGVPALVVGKDENDVRSFAVMHC